MSNYYEKMEYKLLPNAYRMLPKLFISAKEYAEKLMPEEFLDSNYNAGKHTKRQFRQEVPCNLYKIHADNV
jgi:CRISPR-associated protein Cpf1